MKIAKKLIIEYSHSLKSNICLRDFEKEMEEFPGEYAPPEGAVLLAFVNNSAVGCVVLRPLQEDLCEMKRLYVKPEYRGLSIGNLLVRNIIPEARKIGYKGVRLDTLPEMKEAQSLYSKLGFVNIPEYGNNHFPGAHFMELDLKKELKRMKVLRC